MRKRLAYLLFGTGVLLLLVHTTMPALWQVFAVPGQYPLASDEGLLGIAAGFTPPLGAACMLFAGLTYGGGEGAR